MLHKFCVRSSDSPMKLLKVIKNPVTNHLPVGCKKIAMSFSAKEVKNPRSLVPSDEPIAIIIGAMAHGQVSTVNLLFHLLKNKRTFVKINQQFYLTV